MTPVEMVESFKDHLHAGNNFWSGGQIWRRLFDSQQAIIRYIVSQDPSFFVETHDIALGGSSLYDLPINARLGTRLIFTENRANPIGTEVDWAWLDNYPDLSGTGLSSLVTGAHITLDGQQLRIMPATGSSQPSSVRVWYSPSFGNMIEGVANSATSTTLACFTDSAPNYTNSHGWVDPRDDYYNGMWIMITSGTGAGQMRKIKDYTGSTRVFTVDSWDITPKGRTDTEVDEELSSFCVLCPVPEDFHHVVVTHAAMTATVKSRTRNSSLRQQFFGSRSMAGELHEMLAWIQKRQDTRLRTVIPADLESI